MVDAAVSFTIEKLGEFVTQHVNIRIGVKDGIEWLKDELGYLHISVIAAGAHQDKDHIRLWTDSVRDISSQALLILERFSAQQEEQAASEQSGVLDRMRSFICICKKEANLYDIGKDIESLKEKIIGIKSRRDEYGINHIINATPTEKRRKRTLLRAASFVHEKDVIGFEDDVRTLLAQLINEDPSLGLISIHGMGGLGKSTLSSKLYHSSELSHFRSRAWVCVSEDYDITHVLRKFIKSFGKDEKDSLLNEMDEVDLLRHLRKILLDGDRYIAVIDDIWDVDVWKKIKSAFPDKKDGSRVIITTRSKIVAEGVDDTCFVHEVRFLSKDESWQLFCKRAKPTPSLEILGKELVDKCGGLPLAIVILSGLLLQNKTNLFWSDVKDNFWRKLKGKSSEIQEILNLSYDDLCPQLRQCFLYLARYPEDHTIDVVILKLLWIAEEFITEADEEDGVDMEDLAEDYVNELINRNMIQINLLSADGKVLMFRVHDIVRDLAIVKAKEHGVMGIFDSSKQHPYSVRLLQGQVRHSIYYGIGKYLKLRGPNLDDLSLRSLAVTNIINKPEAEVKFMYARFKYLKVLDLTGVRNSETIPEEIGDLILLKFLGLGGGFSVIPSSISKLKRLQTLCAPYFSYSTSESYSIRYRYKFPEEMSELQELRHLLFPGIIGNLNIGSNQTKLQTIRYINFTEWIHVDTTKFTNLQTLHIQGDKVCKDLKAEDEYVPEDYSLESIGNLTSLRTLYLFCPGEDISTLKPLSSCKHLKRVSITGVIEDTAELSFLPESVTDLTLKHSYFHEDPMTSLGSLSNLTTLFLGMDAYKGRKMVCSADSFPCLRFLKLHWLPYLRELQVDDRALPSLKAFEIKDYTEMNTRIPLRLTSLPPVPNFPEYLYDSPAHVLFSSKYRTMM